jgi:predicted protein tyrosine phosphatase
MMSPYPFRVTLCGLDELTNHSAAGVTHVLSILDPGFPLPDAFVSYGGHEHLELRFLDVIEATYDPPQLEHVEALLTFGRHLIATPDAHLLVHCHAGISRSTAALLLILAQAQPERPASELAAMLLSIRSKAWPNLRLLELGEPLLGREGQLTAIAGTIYRHQLAQRDHLAEAMIRNGRGREIALAQGSVSDRGNPL